MFPYNVKGDLGKAFPCLSSSSIAAALKQRFDGLPIHEKCYYQSYYPVEDVLLDLERAIDPRAQHSRRLRSKLNATGRTQDCLGMTPLHILACSTKHDVRLYRLLIEKYPENLIINDKWGDIPLLYACWCNAPAAVVQLLIESHKTLFPEYVLDWAGMVETLSRANAPLFCIQNLLETKQTSNSDQDVNWQEVLIGWAKHDANKKHDLKHRSVPCENFKYLLSFDISKRLDSLGVEKWREEIVSIIDGFPTYRSDAMQRTMELVYSKLVSYEQLKEATSLLELALWKTKIDEAPNYLRRGEGSSQKRARIDIFSQRNQCRINSGAEIVVPNVLPYLLPA